MAIVAVGYFVEWLQTSGGPIGIAGGVIPESATGSDVSAAIFALVGAGIALLAALLWLASSRRLGLIAVVLLLSGLLIMATAGYVWLTAEDRFVEFAATQAANPDTTAAEIRDLLPRFFEANESSVEPSFGLYLTLGGGALVLLAGIVAIGASRRRAAAKLEEWPSFDSGSGS